MANSLQRLGQLLFGCAKPAKVAEILRMWDKKNAVLHVAAVHRSLEGNLDTIKVGTSAPWCENDQFVLASCRAIAKSVVLSCATLRAEPRAGRHVVGPNKPFSDAVTDLWHNFGRKKGPEWLAISKGKTVGKIPWDHVFFDRDGKAGEVGRGDVVVGVSADSLDSVISWRDAAKKHWVDIQQVDDLANAIHLARSRQPGICSIEAGPTLTAPSYRNKELQTDYLVLGIHRGGSKVPKVGRFFGDEQLSDVDFLHQHFAPLDESLTAPSSIPPISSLSDERVLHPSGSSINARPSWSLGPHTSIIETSMGTWEFGVWRRK